MFQYSSSPLSLKGSSIRLLRLLPHGDKNAPLRGYLFSYPPESNNATHLYEALSYVWGGSGKPRCILMGQPMHTLPITENLYNALKYLRDSFLDRILWVDSICINQENEREKEHQISLMKSIYSQASRVIVWLGLEDDGDQALKDICVAAEEKLTISLITESKGNAIIRLLKRSWFQRIWVLQEVAAARSILIKCGHTEIDGYAFYLGVDSLRGLYKDNADLQNLIRSVNYLISRAIFRPRHIAGKSSSVSEAIAPLGQLVDMYHTHKATIPHDKIYALLGMSSDNLSKTSPNILPDYRVPWEDLLQRLVKFLLHEDISVETYPDREIAFIKSKGYILGKIYSVQSDITPDGRRRVGIIFKNILGQLGWSAQCILQASGKPIQEGDLICLLCGASRPTIVRLCKDYATILTITATLENIRIGSRCIKWQEVLRLVKLSAFNFSLIWDWEALPLKFQDSEEYEALMRINNRASKNSNIELEVCLEKATRRWNLALILRDIEEYSKAEERFQEAIEGYEIALRKEHSQNMKVQQSLTPSSWAAGNGHDSVANLLLLKKDTDVDSTYNLYCRTPLSLAAEAGHEAVVNLLIKAGEVKIDSKDRDDRTPLWWAAKTGREAIVAILLGTGRVDVNCKDKNDSTPLLEAAREGHLMVVEWLLQEKVDVHIGRIAVVQAAARGGHLSVVEGLLQEKVDVNEVVDGTALQAAAEGGCLAIVERLLQGGADVNAAAAYNGGRTALQAAAEGGHLAVVERLLQTKADVNATATNRGRTALQAAAEGGYLAIVERLLQEGADVNAVGGGTTALQRARDSGHLAVANWLRKAGALR